MSQNCFRVLSERYMSSEIDFVRWNPKYDLLAIATKRGDVILQRLFWKKAWQISSEVASGGGGNPNNAASCVVVVDLCWSSTGKLLSIVYNTGKIIFVEVENGRITFEINEGLFGQQQRVAADTVVHPTRVISKWTEMRKDEAVAENTNGKLTDSFDEGDDLLLPLPPIEKSAIVVSGGGAGVGGRLESEVDAIGFDTSDKNLSLFIISDQSTSRLRFLLNGFFRMADFDLSSKTTKDCQRSSDNNGDFIPVAFDVSANFHKLGAVYSSKSSTESASSELRFGLFETPFTSFSSNCLARLIKRIARVTSACRYIESTIKKLSDFNEDALSELDTKLSKYALSKGNASLIATSANTIGDDFLQMLTFGQASPDLEHFATHSLSDKGMRKLAVSIDHQYRNLIHLFGVNMDSAVSALYHHLTTLKNLAPSLEDDAESGGDDDNSLWEDAIETTAALSLKLTRILDVVENEAKSINLFVRWLHRSVLAITDLEISPTLSHFSYDDADAVAKIILERFCKALTNDEDEDDVHDGKIAPSAARFGLDKRHSLLNDCSLTTIGDNDDQNALLMIPTRPFHKKSLIDCVEAVQESVRRILDRLSTVYSRRFVILGSAPCFGGGGGGGFEHLSSDNVLLSYDSDRSCFRATFSARKESSDYLFITEFDERNGSVIASWRLDTEPGVSRCVVNLDFYTPSVTTALIRERKDGNQKQQQTDWNYVVYQIDVANLASLPQQSKRKTTGESGGGNECRHESVAAVISWDLIKSQSLSEGQFCAIAVSGSRKVGCAVFGCRTRLKLLEMNPDDDTMVQSSMSGEESGAMDTDAV